MPVRCTSTFIVTAERKFWRVASPLPCLRLKNAKASSRHRLTLRKSAGHEDLYLRAPIRS